VFDVMGSRKVFFPRTFIMAIAIKNVRGIQMIGSEHLAFKMIGSEHFGIQNDWFGTFNNFHKT
jgi:hypothetical protein